MITGRRARKRSLIRSGATPAVMIKSLSTMDGPPNFQAGSANSGRTTPLSTFAMPTPQQEVTAYLRQLSILHSAGILTDDEFSAARGRLLGS